VPVNRFWAGRASRREPVAARGARLALPLLALMAPVFCGCKDEPQVDKVLKNYTNAADVKALNVETDPLTAGMTQPLDYQSPKPSLYGIVHGVVTPNNENMVVAPSYGEGGRYYRDFADIYWKLNWMRKALRQGLVPYNMQDEIEKMFKVLKTLPRDGNYEAADEALQRMQKGLEHMACLRILHAAQINDLDVPWSAGLTAVQEYFERIHLLPETQAVAVLPMHPHDTDSDDDQEGGHSLHVLAMADSTSSGATAVQRQAVDLAISYVTRYQAGPRTMMQREWETAIRRTNKLRNNLHAENRPQNNDGDSYDVAIAVNMAAGDSGAIHAPIGAGIGSQAPLEVNYSQM
jgi:hypothetical protein